MADLQLVAEGLGQAFGRTRLFSALDLQVPSGDVLLVRGPNGSGKSTLLRILSGFMRPQEGQVAVRWQGKECPPRKLFHRIGMCTPEMRLYEELTGMETMAFFSKLRGVDRDEKTLQELLRSVGLETSRHRWVKVYSSGMKQRPKLLLATFHEPPILYLDEPGSNLDDEGMDVVGRIIEAQKARGVVILATNDTREFAYGTQELFLGQ